MGRQSAFTAHCRSSHRCCYTQLWRAWVYQRPEWEEGLKACKSVLGILRKCGLWKWYIWHCSVAQRCLPFVVKYALVFTQLLCGLQSHKELKRSMPDCRRTGQATSVCFLAVRWFKTWTEERKYSSYHIRKEETFQLPTDVHFCPGTPVTLITFLLQITYRGVCPKYF